MCVLRGKINQSAWPLAARHAHHTLPILEWRQRSALAIEGLVEAERHAHQVGYVGPAMFHYELPQDLQGRLDMSVDLCRRLRSLASTGHRDLSHRSQAP